MFQGWTNLTFFHWSCEPSFLQRRLPARLQIDTFEGRAWLGLTPFLLTNLRPPFCPPLPWISTFPEMNLRTYVLGPAGPGIWFFSLDAQRALAVIGARATFGLPYYWSSMSVRVQADAVEYFSQRGGCLVRAHVKKLEPIDSPSDLDIFLTARFRLYSLFGGKLLTAHVEHEPWPLRKAEVIEFQETIRQWARLSSCDGTMLVHHSPGVQTRIGMPRTV
jgi:uncharacterized protein YqjF (DUF2071 family)